MPYLPTAQSWLQNSTLLLSARPTTTRIITKYTILHAPSRPSTRSDPIASPSKTKPNTPASAPTATQSLHPQLTKAVLVLKTYDPVSGTCLKYRTDKAADVGRLVAALGTCGRVMAALPEKEKEEELVDAAGDGDGKVKGEREDIQGGHDKDGKGGERGKGGPGGGGGGGGGKKKKGKR